MKNIADNLRELISYNGSHGVYANGDDCANSGFCHHRIFDDIMLSIEGEY